MRLTRLQLFDYRNFHRLDIELPARVAIFVGDNAQGKSNLLESVYLAATTKGLRAETDAQLVNRETLADVLPAARVVAQVETAAGPLKVEVVVTVRDGAHGPIGTKTVKINGKSFILIGVMEEKGAYGFIELDNQVIIPLSTAMGRMFGQRYLNMLVVQCTSAARVPACIERVKKTLRASHQINAGDDDDFIVFTQDQFKQQLGQVAMIFGVVLYSIAGISIIVGAIGIMNIMLVSVTERTREIGVRIAVGARRFDILKQFLAEASIISMFGGAMGIVFGWAISNLLSELTQVLQTYTPPIIIALALLMAVLVGIVSGIYPAIRASRLDPVQALRYE